MHKPGPEHDPQLRQLYEKMEETLAQIKKTTNRQERATLLRLLRKLISEADQHSSLGD